MVPIIIPVKTFLQHRWKIWERYGELKKTNGDNFPRAKNRFFAKLVQV